MNIYKRYRFLSEIIHHAVWLYHRFTLSHRDIEDLLAERGITVSYEAIRLWCNKFGSEHAKRLKRKHQGFGDTFYSDVVDVFLQERHDSKAAKRYFTIREQYANNT
jgi:putative transposase